MQPRKIKINLTEDWQGQCIKVMALNIDIYKYIYITLVSFHMSIVAAKVQDMMLTEPRQKQNMAPFL